MTLTNIVDHVPSTAPAEPPATAGSIRVMDLTARAQDSAESLLARIFASALVDGVELAEATMAIVRSLAETVKPGGAKEPLPLGPGRN